MNQRMFFLLSVAMSIGAARCTSRPAPSPAATAPHAKVAMPVAFEQNGGQAPAPYRFLARHAEHEFAFARASVAIAISGGEEPRVLTLRFDGGRPSDPIAEQPLSGRVNYLRGRDAGAWITDMRTYERIRYPDVYNGIDALFYAAGLGVEYDLVVKPHADPSAIAVRFDGADALEISDAGDLVVRAGDSTFVQRRPTVYQTRDGRRTPIDASYRVDDDRVTLSLGAYSRDDTLVIDPIMAFATRWGGSSNDYVRSVASDAAGNVYLTGSTMSPDLPATAGALEPAKPNPSGGFAADSVAAFVAKLTPEGRLVYSTYLGGASGASSAQAIAVDAEGNAYVAGATGAAGFPTTPGAFRSTCACHSFLVKLNPSGSSLVFGTYFGGSGWDEPRGLAVDASGEAHVTGSTQSRDFFTTSGAVQRALRGEEDAFLTKFSASGASLIYSTYFGGSARDAANGLALDAGGDAYIVGGSGSTDLPLRSAVQAWRNGPTDAFIAKFSPSGSLMLSTYYGGSSYDTLGGVSIASDGTIYAAGTTWSATVPGANVAIPPQDTAAFVLQYLPFSFFEARLLAGNGGDSATAIVFDDATRTVHVGGSTWSTNFPVTDDAMQPAIATTPLGAPPDTFYVTYPLDARGFLATAPSFSTYVGGTFSDHVATLASDRRGGVYIAGDSDRPDFPMVNARWTGRAYVESYVAHVVPGDRFTTRDARDIVLYAADATRHGNYVSVADPTAAAARRLTNPDRGAAKLTAPLASPADYFEMTFNAPAGVDFRLWMRGRAQNDSTSNDSVYAQFSDSVDRFGRPIWRIGSTSAMALVLEECSGCGVANWGWHDDGWGVGNRGPAVRFATSGPHTLRIQVREDGLAIDQLLLSSSRWLTNRPGTARNTTTVYPRTVEP